MDGDVSSTDTDDEWHPPTDLYCTEDEDALHRLYVRTRRRRKRRRRRRTTRRRTRVHLHPNMEADDVFRAVPASSVAIASLPKTTVGEGSERGECGVCLDEYEAGDVLRTMPCSHGFHERCIVTWLRASRLCPLCRFKLLPPKKGTVTDDEDDGKEAKDDEDHEKEPEDDDDDNDESETGHDDEDGALEYL